MPGVVPGIHDLQWSTGYETWTETGRQSPAMTGDDAVTYELPINMPATNTSTPPTTTWNVARSNGVSM